MKMNKKCLVVILLFVGIISIPSFGTTIIEKSSIPTFNNNAAFDPNNPPYVPSNPNPPDGGIMTPDSGPISWTGGDPDLEDILSYVLYLAETNPPNIIIANTSCTIYVPEHLNLNTTYYWKIIAWDNHGASTEGPIWNFTTKSSPNHPPYPPSNPDPKDGETGVSIGTIFSWTGGDPDIDDLVTYDVYLGTSIDEFILVYSIMEGEEYLPEYPLVYYDTTYYWKIVAWDNHGASTEGPIWNFTTKSEPSPPVLELNGTMGENGWYVSDVTITFTWYPGEIRVIYYRIDGGEWTVYAESIIVSEDGEHIFEWYCVDIEGNVSDVHGPFDFKIDQTQPTIDLTVENIGDNTWLFIADVSDETSGINRVKFFVDSEYVGEVTEAPYEWEWSGDWYDAESIVYDNAGNLAIDECFPPIPIRVFGFIRNPEFTEESVSFFAIVVVADNTFVCVLQQLTFQNDYSGHIGKFFINAVFEGDSTLR